MKEDTPVAGLELPDPGPESVDLATLPQSVEVRIERKVYEAARVRAVARGQALAAVARTVLFQVAEETPDDAPPPESRPPLRPYGQKRERLRFDVPMEAYLTAKDKITRSGRSVSQAVEDGLARYAETGLL